jgi:SAM-dependent methyltransferase
MARSLGSNVIRQRKWRNLRNAIFPTARSLLVRSSLDRLALKSFQSVLVIGAGDDPYRVFFGDPRRYITLDLVAYAGTDVIGNAHAIPFASDSFDCLLVSEVLEHLCRPESFASEARRVLVDGGKIVLTVPFMFHNHADPHDYWRLTRDGFRQVFHDFSSIEIYAQGNRLHVLSDLITTAFSPLPALLPLRALNHVFRLVALNDSKSSAPSGFLVVAIK